jgi:hypothetical protein
MVSAPPDPVAALVGQDERRLAALGAPANGRRADRSRSGDRTRSERPAIRTRTCPSPADGRRTEGMRSPPGNLPEPYPRAKSLWVHGPAGQMEDPLGSLGHVRRVVGDRADSPRGPRRLRVPSVKACQQRQQRRGVLSDALADYVQRASALPQDSSLRVLGPARLPSVRGTPVSYGGRAQERKCLLR